MKINKDKAVAQIDAAHSVAEHFVTRCGELSEHITDRLAFTVSSVATISVAITSVIPEGMAVSAASGSSALGIAAASASVAGVFVAMRRPAVWWIYAAQLTLSLSLVRVYGGGPLMLYPLVSCFGALIAAFGIDAVEQRVAESKAADRADIDAELERQIKMMRAKQNVSNSAMRTQAKYGSPQPQKNPEMSEKSSDNGVAVSPVNGVAGAAVEDMTAVRTSRKAQRWEDILTEMEGQETKSFVKSMAAKHDKDPRTIRRDLRGLAEQGLASVNGTVERSR